MTFLHNLVYRHYFLVTLRGHIGYFLRYLHFKFTNRLISILPNRNVPRKYYLSACVRIKNEARFMPEFLAYYKSLGFEHVYIYDNNSTDEISQILKPFIDEAFVSIVDWPRVPAYPSCYIDFFSTKACESKWVAFVDADEFIVEKKQGELLSLLKSTRASSIGINWRMYGSSGHEKLPSGLVIENFLMTDEKYNAHVKVVVDPAKVTGLWNSHNFFYKHLRYSVSATGQVFWGTFVRPSKNAVVWINHYVYRSKEDSLRKATQGYVDPQGYIQKARTLETINQEFDNHNEVEKAMTPEKLCEVKNIMIAMGYSSPYVCTD
ncbi:glycosyltransferase family 92 protein [Uliginosibacterium gangwonense]|uniref:glycosyltransferase family 92 protein n=1 Tax=Uliginosibacterium gangwonense TaxID=392736 RepID=UPI00036DF4F1|nr:glycosyltransferase family 92 protein [Uliginosibacterium gangwonense]